MAADVAPDFRAFGFAALRFFDAVFFAFGFDPVFFRPGFAARVRCARVVFFLAMMVPLARARAKVTLGGRSG